MTDVFDPDDSEHVSIRLGIERGNGIPALQTKATAEDAMKIAGFELVVTEDLGLRDDPLSWWYPIAGDTTKAEGFKDWLLVVRNTKYGRYAVRALVAILEFVRVAPKGTARITEELISGADALILGGKKGVFTPMLLMVGKKASE